MSISIVLYFLTEGPQVQNFRKRQFSSLTYEKNQIKIEKNSNLKINPCNQSFEAQKYTLSTLYMPSFITLYTPPFTLCRP
jgi:hypothetical protein